MTCSLQLVRCSAYRPSSRWWSLQNAGHASDGDHLLDCNDPFGDFFLLNHDGARMPISWRRPAAPVKQRVADKSRLVSSLTRVYARLPTMDRSTLSSKALLIVSYTVFLIRRFTVSIWLIRQQRDASLYNITYRNHNNYNRNIFLIINST